MLTPRTGDSGELTANLWRIVQTARTFFAPDHCAIVAFNPITKHFMWRISLHRSGATEDYAVNKALTPGGQTASVLTKGRLLVEDVQLQPEAATEFTRQHGIQAFATIPIYLVEQANPLALLYMDYQAPHRFTVEEQGLLHILAHQAGLILQQSWLLFRYAEIRRISQEVNQGIETVELLFEKLVPLVSTILNSSHFFMLAAYQRGNRMVDLHVVEDGQRSHLARESLQGASQWAITHREPLHIQQLSVEKDTLPFQLVPLPGQQQGEESLIFVPLLLRDVPLGVLSVQHPDPGAYDEEDVRILRLLGTHVASALNNIRLFEALQQVNESGQQLTQQVEAEDLLQFIVEHLHTATGADVVVLYPYLHDTFEAAPWISGAVFEPTYTQQIVSFEDHVAVLTIRQRQPVFAHDSLTLYRQLGATSERRGNFEQREHIRSTAAVPLYVKHEPIGALFLNFRQPQRFDTSQRQLIESLANYAAITIANSRVFQSQKDRTARELEFLQQVDHALSQTLGLKATLETILGLATAHLSKETSVFRSAIFLFNADQEALKSEATLMPSRPTEHQPITLYLAERRGLVWLAFEQRVPVRVADVAAPEWHDLYIEAVSNTVSELDVPLIADETVVGVLNFESTQEGGFSAADEEFLVTLAGQVVLAIKNAQTYEREKRLADERQALFTISAEINRQMDPSVVFNMILDQALALTNSSTGTLMCFDDRTETFWMAAERGVETERKQQGHGLSEGIVGFAGSRKTLVNVPDMHAPPWNTIHLQYIPDTRSELAVPLLEDGTLRGVLNIESTQRNAFSQHDERLLTAFADLAVSALQNAERYQQATQRQQQLRALNEVDKHSMSQTDDINLVMRAMLDHALALTQDKFALRHNLGDHLGYVPTAIKAIRSKLAGQGVALKDVLERLDLITKDVEIVLALAQDLKTNMAQVNEGDLPPRDPKPIRVAELFERLRLHPVPSAITVEVLPLASDLVVYAVAHEVDYILHNLWVNAIDAMRTGGKLTVRAEERATEIVIMVQDTGMGIADHQKERIFDLFYTSKNSSGFGLWSSRRYAQVNGGSLTVESQLGQGATFILTLPLARNMPDPVS